MLASIERCGQFVALSWKMWTMHDPLLKDVAKVWPSPKRCGQCMASPECFGQCVSDPLLKDVANRKCIPF